jgi:hypothetical protein
MQEGMASYEDVYADGDDGTVAGVVVAVPNRESEQRESSPSTRRTSWTADELMAEAFPALLWAVAGIVAAGLNLLAGAPKLGKSWLALNLAVAIAAGGRALGRIEVDAGDVLYLALEDNPRRMQDRLRTVLAGSDASPRLTIAVECEPLPRGGDDRIRRWLDDHPDARLVIVDVFARVRGHSDVRADRYADDYAAAFSLKKIADQYGVAVLLVHHTRKQDSSDFLDMVSGTNGLAGAADAILVLTRARNTKQAVLKVTGRDVEEAEYALELDPRLGAWQMLDGAPADYAVSDERRRIAAAVRAQEGIGPKAIADITGIDHDVVRQLVRKMVKDGQLDTDGAGHYLSSVHTVHSVHTEHGEQ